MFDFSLALYKIIKPWKQSKLHFIYLTYLKKVLTDILLFSYQEYFAATGHFVFIPELFGRPSPSPKISDFENPSDSDSDSDSDFGLE
jgi:hypothetical protein